MRQSGGWAGTGRRIAVVGLASVLMTVMGLNVFVASAYAAKDTTHPSKVSGVKAVAGVGQVTLTWSAAKDNKGVTGYRVKRSTYSNMTHSVTLSSAVKTRTYASKGLSDNKTYYFTVAARDAAGNWGTTSSIVKAKTPISIVALSLGNAHTVGLRSTGTVVAAGDSFAYTGTSSWTGVKAIAAGDRHTVGLKSNGTVVAVGGNDYGRLDVSGWTGITAIATGNNNTVGLKADGTVVIVGDNYFGQVAAASWTDIKAIAITSWDTVLGLKDDGTVVAAGYNASGQCNVSGWTDIKAIAAGGFFTVGLRNDGTVVATGNNAYGQLDVGSWTGIKAIAAGEYHLVGLRNDGTVAAAGWDVYGQVSGVSAWTDIRTIAAGGYHTAAIRSNGTVTAIGNNNDLQCEVTAW
jgi:alpha-tubulin suppressor-like RCC1 family protein